MTGTRQSKGGIVAKETAYKEDFVLLGNGFPAYTAAYAAYSATGKSILVIGEKKKSPLLSACFIRYQRCPTLLKNGVLLSLLLQKAKDTAAPAYLLPTDGDYALLLRGIRDALSRYYRVILPPDTAYDAWRTEESFYQACKHFCIPAPKGKLLPPDAEKESLLPDRLGFSYPAVLKPADLSLYRRHPFPKMRSLYTVNSPEEVREKIALWYRAGYTGKALLQEKIEGNAESLHKLFFYADQNSKIKLSAAARVLCCDRSKAAPCRYPALLRETPPPIARILGAVLGRLGYTGFCSFTVKYDIKSGKHLLLSAAPLSPELFSLLTHAGENPLTLLISDTKEGSLPYSEGAKPFFWHAVPIHVALTAQSDRLLRLEAEKCLRKKKHASPFPPYTAFSRLPRIIGYRLLYDIKNLVSLGKNRLRFPLWKKSVKSKKSIKM